MKRGLANARRRLHEMQPLVYGADFGAVRQKLKLKQHERLPQMSRYSAAEIEESRDNLLKWIKPGDTVHCVLRGVARSGMSREIGLVLIKPRDRGESHFLLHPNFHAARVLGLPLNERKDGIKIRGCGMDMGFALVHALGEKLWPAGTPCEGDHPGTAGGYAIKHEWI